MQINDSIAPPSPTGPSLGSQNWLAHRINSAKDTLDPIYETGMKRQRFVDRKGKRVVFSDGKTVTEFMSCSYLGLECDPRINKAAISGIEQFGVQFAAARTRLAPTPIDELEVLLTQIFGAATVTFATCGLSHLATLPLLGAGVLPNYSLKGQRPCWLLDKKAHASLQCLRGVLEQFGPVKRIDFQNRKLLARTWTEVAIEGFVPLSISDGVGSMGGVAPLELIKELCLNFGGYAYVDDAHGTSILGKHGAGLITQVFGAIPEQFMLVSSLSKAFGATGGAITLSSNEDAEVIRRYSTPYAFGGPISLPGVCAGVASANIHMSDEILLLQDRLRKNIEYFDSLNTNFPIINQGELIPIRGIEVGCELIAGKISKHLFNTGFATTCATYPTVEKSKAMIRVALSAIHTRSDIDSLVAAIKDVSRFVAKERE